jgi:hypothetical protein
MNKFAPAALENAMLQLAQAGDHPGAIHGFSACGTPCAYC